MTTPIWDLVFGTYQQPEIIPVPEKLKMRWLTDPDTGEVKPEHGSAYSLRRTRPRRSADAA